MDVNTTFFHVLKPAGLVDATGARPYAVVAQSPTFDDALKFVAQTKMSEFAIVLAICVVYHKVEPLPLTNVSGHINVD